MGRSIKKYSKYASKVILILKTIIFFDLLNYLFYSQTEIEQRLGTLEIQGKNPVVTMLSVLGRRGVRLEHLKESFKAIRFEEGLRIIEYPNEELNSEREFPILIKLTSGSQLILSCKTSGFPYPKHVYHRNGIPIFSGNPFIIEKTT